MVNFNTSMTGLLPYLMTTSQINSKNVATKKTQKNTLTNLPPNNYILRNGDGVYTMSAKLAPGLLPNRYTILSLLEYNKILPDSIPEHSGSIDLEHLLTPGKQVSFPKTPENINNLTESQYSIIAYRVKQDEALSSIAKKFTGNAENWKVLARLNGISNPNKIHRGQILYIPKISNLQWGNKLHIPEIVKHNVANNETLSRIAEKYTGNYLNAPEIMNLNKITNNNLIKSGTSLKVPIMYDDNNHRINTRFHIVMNDETLGSIIQARAQELNISDPVLISTLTQQTIEYSNIENPDKLSKGQIIFLPPLDYISDKTETEPQQRTEIPKTIKPLPEIKAENIKATEAKPKRNRATAVPTFTTGVTTNSLYWKTMIETIQQNYPQANLSVEMLAKIFDVAHLVMKETLPATIPTTKNKIEMQIIALTVMNRLTVVKELGNKTKYDTMWGLQASIEAIISHPSAYSCFNTPNSESIENLNTIYSLVQKDGKKNANNIYCTNRWETGVIAAYKVLTGDLSDIPEKYRKVVSYYNPKYEYARENMAGIIAEKKPGTNQNKYNTINSTDKDGFDHIFLEENTCMPGRKSLDKNQRWNITSISGKNSTKS